MSWNLPRPENYPLVVKKAKNLSIKDFCNPVQTGGRHTLAVDHV